jgi:hypothetical protein
MDLQNTQNRRQSYPKDHKKPQNRRKEHPQKRDQSIEKVPSGPLPSDFHKNEPSAKILNPSEVQKSCSRRGGALIFEDHREPTATILNPSEVQKSCSRRGGALIFDDHTEPSAKKLNPSEVQKSCSRRGGVLIFEDHTETSLTPPPPPFERPPPRCPEVGPQAEGGRGVEDQPNYHTPVDPQRGSADLDMTNCPALC